MASRIRSFFSAPRRRRQQAGAAIVEAMIFVPMVFLLTFLTLEVTNILRVYETLSWTAEYAVRQASEGMRTDGKRLFSDEVRSLVYDKIRFDLPVGEKHIDADDIFCVRYFRPPNDPDFACADIELAAGEHGLFPNERDFQPGDFVSVKMNLHYAPMLSGMFEWMFPDGVLTMSVTFDRVISAAALPSSPPGGGGR
ncbi:TadE/TadG family type IV pilus assembly protein [Halochromatium salexigens]|uniref:TadE/TadG family type IV pilus assembly protein n=1 Tax=Halochromatium salexigens TaxID=49447 RepID=UPI001914A6C0|nr:TadE family protein [Halochromatium salexigens]